MAVDEGALKKAVDAALEGPGEEDVKIDEHSFNVDAAEVTKTLLTVTVDGSGDGKNISHRLAWREDDQVNYKFTVIVGQDGIDVEDVDIDIDRGGFLATYGPIIKWVIEHWDEIRVIFEDGEPIAETVQEIRSLPEMRQATESVLDGSWEGEALFIILNIATVAAGGQLARLSQQDERPPWFKDVLDASQVKVVQEVEGIKDVQTRPAIVSNKAKLLVLSGTAPDAVGGPN